VREMLFDFYTKFWNERFGVNFRDVKGIDLEELWLRSHLLMLNKNKEKAREKYKDWFRRNRWRIMLKNKKRLADTILNTTNSNLPFHSIYIQIKLTLKKPYLSKDDDDFYIIDNPIVKDKVFKLPMVRATTWKGALRFAAIKVFEEEFDKSDWKKKRVLLVRLFGNEKDALENYLNKFIATKLGEGTDYVKEEFENYLMEKGYISKETPSRSGRLFFYPTFFEEISLDVITPLSRETRTPAKGPIYFETVPENAKGIFRLLYYPFDLIARGELDKIEGEIKDDMEFLSKALQKMFYEIGFSAKKSSGFGVISEFDGEVSISFKGIENAEFESFDELSFSKLCTKVNKNVNGGVSE